MSSEIIEHIEEVKQQLTRASDLSDDLQQLSRALDKLIVQVETLDASQDDIEDELDDIDDRVQKLRNDFARLNPEQLKRRINEIEERIEKLFDRGASLDWQDNTDKRLKNLENTIDQKVDSKALYTYVAIVVFFIGLIGTIVGWFLQFLGG
jgi:chromosome segregation ATPase